LRGEFQVRVSGAEPFRLRLLILFLRGLEVPEKERTRRRRIRTGRAPFVRQSQVAEWFGVAQPHVEALRQTIGHIFQAKTKRTAQKRYDQVIALRQQYVSQNAEAAALFDFLERHWPQLVNAIESEIIPKTNNAVEMVIRRFDQHYQNFCGFENIETAQLYLAVFEKLYRFTPFSDDAQPAIRGKCPLELAGYDLSQMPMTALCQGLSLDWPLELTHNDVPN
jgi:hypothetical protein